jgi:hypothetical protein
MEKMYNWINKLTERKDGEYQHNENNYLGRRIGIGEGKFEEHDGIVTSDSFIIEEGSTRRFNY